jgi:hypothetical protein
VGAAAVTCLLDQVTTHRLGDGGGPVRDPELLVQPVLTVLAEM